MGTLQDSIHGLSGQNVDMAGMMKMPLNLAAELENLKQQTAEIELLEKKQAENDRSAIQVLQNQVFFLEAKLSKFPSTQDF